MCVGRALIFIYPPNSCQIAEMSPAVWPIIVGCWPLSLLHLCCCRSYRYSFLNFTSTNDLGHLNSEVLDYLQFHAEMYWQRESKPSLQPTFYFPSTSGSFPHVFKHTCAEIPAHIFKFSSILHTTPCNTHTNTNNHFLATTQPQGCTHWQYGLPSRYQIQEDTSKPGCMLRTILVELPGS